MALALRGVDVSLLEQAARAADHFELEQLVGVLPDLDCGAQPGLECGHGGMGSPR